MSYLAEKYGINLNYDNSVRKVSVPDGAAVKNIEIMKTVRDSHLIINLPKFKTHNLTVFTGAVKNMFGIIPGMAKPGYRFRFFKFEMFCNLLIDIATGVRPGLNIMDAVTGMEGNGPEKAVFQEKWVL